MPRSFVVRGETPLGPPVNSVPDTKAGDAGQGRQAAAPAYGNRYTRQAFLDPPVNPVAGTAAGNPGQEPQASALAGGNRRPAYLRPAAGRHRRLFSSP